MKNVTLPLLLIATLVTAQKPKKAEPTVYYPDQAWQHKTPADVGMDEVKLKKAVDFAIANETTNPKNLELNHYQSFGIREPLSDPLGPLPERGAANGIIIKNGYIIATWGDIEREDICNSVTKSFLSSVVGLAYDKGLIRSIDDTVYRYVAPIKFYNPLPQSRNPLTGEQLYELFNTPHNRTITWDHLLRQVSDWEGTLWGRPDWADRPDKDVTKWIKETRNRPGSVYEYNDVRVNALALATLNVWRKPLPEVFKENIMDPIGASLTWRWYGYDNSWIVLDGKIVQSVSGGGHWGGGTILNATDMARFGYLTLRDGKWKDKQILSQQWINWSRTPTQAEPTYGFMNWFLNTDKKYLPSAPASAFAHIGNGTNMIYVDKENDIVAVVRWIDDKAKDEFIKKMLEAKIK
jgi:Beta-lactamase